MSNVQVEVADDHLMPLGFPNMWTVFKVVDRVTGEPVAGPDIQVVIVQEMDCHRDNAYQISMEGHCSVKSFT
jgi:hypothetical protein